MKKFNIDLDKDIDYINDFQTVLDYKSKLKFDEINGSLLKTSIAKLFLFSPDFKDAFFIYGNCGIGKTVLLDRLIQYEKINNKLNSEIHTFSENMFTREFKYQSKKIISFAKINMIDWIQGFQRSWNKTFNEKNSDYYTQVNEVYNVNVLIIDDFGAEKIHETTFPLIQELFDKRYAFTSDTKLKCITYISSNYSLEDILKRYKNLLKNEIDYNRFKSRVEGLITYEIHLDGLSKRDIKNNIPILKKPELDRDLISEKLNIYNDEEKLKITETIRRLQRKYKKLKR